MKTHLCKKLYSFFIIYLFLISVLKLYSSNNLVYPIKNYLIEDYNAGTQNWDITELHDGTMCFANNQGLLVKNGNDWHVYKTEHYQIIRCVIEHRNKIYVGGGAEFGYFQKDLSGHFNYTSLSNNIETKWGEVWRIETKGDRIYFQAAGTIFVFDAKSDKFINQIQLDRIEYFQIVENDLFFQTTNEGFFSTDFDFRNKKIIVDKTHLSNYMICGISNINGELLIFTINHGIYRFENNVLVPCDRAIHNIASYSQIYCAMLLKDKIVLGTILDGIYILDLNLNIKKHINTRMGLKNNTILSLYADSKDNIWAGLDNGISYIEINSQLLYYKFNKDIGVGYASFKQGAHNYWGTNQGLYYTNDNFSINDIELIPGTQGQVWCLKEIGGKLYCGHHKGLFQVEKNKAIPIADKPGVMNIVRLGKKSNYYLVINYFELFLYKNNKSKGTFEKVSNIDNFLEIPRDIKIDKKDWLWYIKGDELVKFKIDTTKCSIGEYDTYEMKGEKYLFSFDNDILVWLEGSFYQYDQKKLSFSKKDEIIFEPHHRSDLIEMIYHIPIESLCSGISNCDTIIGDLSRLKNRLQWNVQFLSVHDNYYIINENDGFMNYDTRLVSKLHPQIKIILSEVKINSKADNEYRWIESNDLEYANNNIRFKFSSNDNPNIVYQYKLVGFDENYSPFLSKNSKEYTNLPEGAYNFEVRAKDINGNISEPANFKFTIRPPFYRSNIAKVTYLTLFLLAIIGLSFFVKNLIRRKENQLNIIRSKEIEKLERIHKIEALSNEKTIILIEKDKLEESIAHKQRELANSTHSIIGKNNLLMDIKELLQSIYKEKNTDLRDAKLKEIFNSIDSNINNEEDWAVFENYFSEIHQNFFSNIKRDFPDISPTDLKLCAYIKLNKSTKEIASLMNISIRGVETSRYRLRKKLNLDRNENILDIISKY